MKSNQPNFMTPRDTPATRKRRLQMRLQELSDKSEQELSILLKSVEKMKANFRTTEKV